MARPIKSGLDYYPLDVDILQDVKIKKLLHQQGGRALAVYVVLLSTIYKHGYYMDYEDDSAFMLAYDLHEQEDYVKEVIQYCVDIDLFNRKLFDEYHILTSHSIQERYNSVCRLCKRTSVISKYNLLSSCIETSEKTIVSSQETNINTEDSTQKKEKINKKKPSSTAHECTCEDTENDLSDINIEISQLMASDDWMMQISQFFSMNMQSLKNQLIRFALSCHCRGISKHTDINDCKRHFIDWLRKEQQDINPKNKIVYAESNYNVNRRRATPCTPGATQADYEGAF